jgi:transposase
MNLIKTQTKSRTTYYVQKSFRDRTGKSTSKVVERLGTLEELAVRFGADDPLGAARAYVAELTRREKELQRKVTVEFSPSKLIKGGEQRRYNGGYLFVQKAYHDFGLDRVCEAISDRHKAKFDLDEALKVLVYARILYPGSKRSSLEDAGSFIERPKVELHQVYRALSLLAGEQDYIQAQIFKRSQKVLRRNTDVIYYDVTNYFFEWEEEGGLVQYGHCKERRPLPIVQMGLFMDADGLPLAFCIEPGDAGEQGTLLPLEQKLQHQFGVPRMIVCTDCGLSSYDNRLGNMVGQRDFITVQSLKKLREEHQGWAIGTEGWRLWQRDGDCHDDGIRHDIGEIDEEKFRDATFFKETWFVDEVKVKGKDGKMRKEQLSQRIIVTYSVKYRDYLRHIRERQVARAAAVAGKGAKAVERTNQNNPKRYLSLTSTTEDGEVASRHEYFINQDMIDQEARFDGFYAVCTSLEGKDWPAEEVLHRNGFRWKVEDLFRVTKTDLKARPVFLKRDERIKAHFLTCFIALFLTQYLLGRVNLGKKKDEKYSVHELIDTLRGMDFLLVDGEGYVPIYTRNDLTNRLHGSAGFRTDTQIVTKRQMKTIQALTKKMEAPAD